MVSIIIESMVLWKCMEAGQPHARGVIREEIGVNWLRVSPVDN